MVPRGLRGSLNQENKLKQDKNVLRFLHSLCGKDGPKQKGLKTLPSPAGSTFSYALRMGSPAPACKGFLGIQTYWLNKQSHLGTLP